MDNKNIKKKVLIGLVWKFMERGGAQVVQFLVSLILARFLLPEEYGLVGLISVFISLANVFVQVGLTTALIQKKDVDDEDYSTVFYLNFGISIILYLILYFSAPVIAKFYNENLLISILRVQSISIILSSLISVQNAVLSRRMEFKKSFYRNMGSVISYGIIGIAMAYNNFGVWSLVIAQLISNFIGMIILWFTVDWRPKMLFSIYRVKELYSFGSKMLFSGILYTIFNNIYQLVIGKLFNKDILGYYNRGQNIPSLLVNNVNETISGVMFPALSVYQNDKGRLKELLRRSMVTSCFLVFPLMIGLAVIAKPLTIVLLTEKWLPSVPFMQISCITFAFYPLHTANLQAISAMGRSDIYLKLEVIKKIIIIITLLVTIPFGIYAVIVGSAVNSVLSTIINAWPNKKLLNYTFKEQIVDIAPSFTLALVMGILILPIKNLNFPILVILIIQVLLGMVIYILGAYLLRLECFTYLINIIFKFVKKDNGDRRIFK